MATPTGKRLEKTQRRHRLLRAVEGGATIAAAAEREGVTPDTAGRIIREALAELDRQNEVLAEHLREIEVERLNTMQRELWPLIERQDPYVFCQGCGSTAESANAIEHESYCEAQTFQLVPAKINMQAFDRLLKISERRSKLLGLDSATKVSVSGTIAHEHELVDDDERERLERAWRRREAVESSAVELPVGD